MEIIALNAAEVCLADECLIANSAIITKKWLRNIIIYYTVIHMRLVWLHVINIYKGIFRMKKFMFALLVAVLAVTPALFAGTYTLDNKIVHLQGDTSTGKTFWLESQVKLQFNHIKLGWTHNGRVDRVRYHITCLDGQAVLQNVEYVDEAVDNTKHVRWIQSDTNLERDFSFFKDDADFRRSNVIKYSTKLDVKPADYKTGEVRFHFEASGRHYIVIWEARSNNLITTWEKLR